MEVSGRMCASHALCPLSLAAMWMPELTQYLPCQRERLVEDDFAKYLSDKGKLVETGHCVQFWSSDVVHHTQIIFSIQLTSCTAAGSFQL